MVFFFNWLNILSSFTASNLGGDDEERAESSGSITKF
jgi:hypothetical protein